MRFRRLTPHFVFAALVAVAAALSLGAALAVPLPNGADEFNSPGFIVRHSWEKYGSLLATPFHDGLDEADRTELVARFIELNRSIDRERRAGSDPSASAASRAAANERLQELLDERGSIENDVETIIEGRLTAVAKDAGITRHYGGDVVWPPVDLEFEDPPHVLVESPRDEIRIEHETLLEGDLTPERVRALEAQAESDGKTSAVVVQIGGIAMYPAIVPNDSDYQSLMRGVAHEWMHHYLFFTPLGRRYFLNADLRTLNETVADLAGKELGDLIVERYPLPATAQPEPSTTPAPTIDFVAQMRALRRQVEELLKADKIVEAERLMDEKRDFFADHGIFIRRINQAYFAFHGSYADTASSINPIGPKLQDLRDQSASLAQFVDRARDLTSPSDLDAALASAR